MERTRHERASSVNCVGEPLKRNVGLFHFVLTMEEQAEWRRWNLNGLTVTQLRVDYQFHLHMWSLEQDLLITFATPFTLRSSKSEVHILDPEQSESLCPLLSLLHRPVETFSASSTGECVLRFEDGTELRGVPMRGTNPGSRTGREGLRMHPCFVVSAPIHPGAEGAVIRRHSPTSACS